GRTRSPVFTPRIGVRAPVSGPVALRDAAQLEREVKRRLGVLGSAYLEAEGPPLAVEVELQEGAAGAVAADELARHSLQLLRWREPEGVAAARPLRRRHGLGGE